MTHLMEALRATVKLNNIHKDEGSNFSFNKLFYMLLETIK